MVCADPRLHTLHITIGYHKYQIFRPERILWREISLVYEGVRTLRLTIEECGQ